MTGHAYEQSADIAGSMGPFPGYHDSRCARCGQAGRKRQRRSMLEVIGCIATRRGIQPSDDSVTSRRKPARCWDRALVSGKKHGYRNAQVTVLAPTGTIGFLMDCDTTGIEPDIALVKYKLLAGGGMLKIVNQTVKRSAAAPRLRRGADRANHRAHRQARHHRGRGRRRRHDHRQRPQAGGSAGVRLRVQAVPRRAFASLSRAHST